MFTHPGKVSKCRGAHVTRPRGRAGRNPPGTREHTAEPGGRLQLKVDNSTSRRRVGVRVWGAGAGCGRGVRAWGAGVGCGRGVRAWGAGVGCGRGVRVWGAGRSWTPSQGHSARPLGKMLRLTYPFQHGFRFMPERKARTPYENTQRHGTRSPGRATHP